MSLTICEAGTESVREIAALRTSCFGETVSEGVVRGTAGNPTAHMFAAYDDGVMVAQCALYTVVDEVTVESVSVLKEYRRRGIGEALLSHALDFGRRCGGKKAYLEVRESNGAARAMYEKLGFTPDGTRKNYYSEPREDAILMSAEL